MPLSHSSRDFKLRTYKLCMRQGHKLSCFKDMCHIIYGWSPEISVICLRPAKKIDGATFQGDLWATSMFSSRELVSSNSREPVSFFPLACLTVIWTDFESQHCCCLYLKPWWGDNQTTCCLLMLDDLTTWNCKSTRRYNAVAFQFWDVF